MEAAAPTRADRQMATIKSLILSRISVSRAREGRKEYLRGKETIAELSARLDIPPVLLWTVLTPLYDRTQAKYRHLRMETAIYTRWTKGDPIAEIARQLQISEEEVANYTSERFSERAFALRPWYKDRHLLDIEDEEQWVAATGAILPPASRVGQIAGELTGIVEEKLGRCPTCGKKVHMPCYACWLRDYLKNHKVPKAQEVEDDEEEELLPSLMFR